MRASTMHTDHHGMQVAHAAYVGRFDSSLGTSLLFRGSGRQERLMAAVGWTAQCRAPVASSAARSPYASVTALSLAQKCMKNKRGSSVSM